MQIRFCLTSNLGGSPISCLKFKLANTNKNHSDPALIKNRSMRSRCRVGCGDRRRAQEKARLRPDEYGYGSSRRP